MCANLRSLNTVASVVVVKHGGRIPWVTRRSGVRYWALGFNFSGTGHNIFFTPYLITIKGGIGVQTRTIMTHLFATAIFLGYVAGTISMLQCKRNLKWILRCCPDATAALNWWRWRDKSVDCEPKSPLRPSCSMGNWWGYLSLNEGGTKPKTDERLIRVYRLFYSWRVNKNGGSE